MAHSLETLNAAVDARVARGDYRGALELPRAFAPRDADTASALLVQINLAEAEYNLGRWTEAWDRLRGLDPLAAAFPIARAGLSQQRAWIAAHAGRADEALHHWYRAELADLPRRYHAEHFFTGAVARIAAGDLAAADRCARAGAHVAVRVSSRRNALAVCGRVAAAMEDWDQAERLLRAAALHPWRGQGGDALLLWGDVLFRLGRPDDARHAYGLAIDRDPQSESAQLARMRRDGVA
ncbi:MAG TPA: tetratricopeptide repeat protein [Myxococcales bacterium]